ncbi:MAG: Crp/Fnr family transcriptional regulator [Actinomycetaceae bacterium]|nr:Crp/Fnr family transcriptional regulator [Actinomycetaceae bacterium]
MPIFSQLTPEQQDAVALLARPVRVKTGDRLFMQGERNAPLIVVHRGAVKLVRTAADGRERVVRVLHEGEFSGEATLLTGARPEHEAVALEDVEACSFRREDFAKLLAEHPQVGLSMMGVLSRRLQESQDLLDQVTSRSVDVRIANYLLSLEAEPVGDDIRVTFPVLKKDVASLLGTTPESLSRALKRLTRRGLITPDGSGIILLDMDGLIALADE